MGSPGDVTANYLLIMQQRGMTWDDLADEFERDAAAGRALDGGANARGMAAWARSQAEAGRERATAAQEQQREPRPDEATPDPRKRTTVPPARPRRTGSSASGAGEV